MGDGNNEISRSLGAIEATLKSIDSHIKNQDGRMDRMDTRLRKVENKTVLTGAVTGGVVSIAIAFIVAKFKLMG
ncbi:MAG: hypothetical protein HRU28_16380 [Rhizobiales bacterium]|nr:hypothetical protein [Hyphomicrobiales bacterium]